MPPSSCSTTQLKRSASEKSEYDACGRLRGSHETYQASFRLRERFHFFPIDMQGNNKVFVTQLEVAYA